MGMCITASVRRPLGRKAYYGRYRLPTCSALYGRHAICGVEDDMQGNAEAAEMPHLGRRMSAAMPPRRCRSSREHSGIPECVADMSRSQMRHRCGESAAGMRRECGKSAASLSRLETPRGFTPRWFFGPEPLPLFVRLDVFPRSAVFRPRISPLICPIARFFGSSHAQVAVSIFPFPEAEVNFSASRREKPISDPFVRL